jgi:hypothetical protein
MPPPHNTISLHPSPASNALRKLLLDEERPQITQLPRTRDTQDKHLNQRPLDHSAIDTLALISKLRLSLSLKHLLSPHILQPCIQIFNLLHHLAHLILIRALNLAGLADHHVELEADAADLVAAEEVAGDGGDVVGGEAETVVSGVGGGEGEFAAAAASLVHDAVVVVEGFVHGYEDALDELCEGSALRGAHRGWLTISLFSTYIRASFDHIVAL